jgi:1-acyl-sn-glycerol-3-phosphate acyltransferase
MLDLERLRRIKLYKKPFTHVLVANIVALDYRLPRRTHVVLEGIENIPRDRGVFLAMNHTDRFNYVPLQYAMHRRGDLRYITNWVKGKYYGNGFLARALDITNNIPMPSRGYVIVSRFRQATGCAPDEGQYRLLRDLVDEKLSLDDARVAQAGEIVTRFLDTGLADYPGDSFLDRFNALFEAMVAQVVALNRRALEERELNILVFPQGTRSRRLSQGHTGLAQMTQHLSVPIVPVGCNGSDKLHSGNVPLSGGGRVVYRIGPPLEVDGPELAPYRVPPEVPPLTRAARTYDDRYRAITEVVMGRINALLDPEYQFAPDAASDGVQGVARFL